MKPWAIFGGKGAVARVVWDRLGTPNWYFEPFAGSLAVLLGRPHPGRQEAVTDTDGLITNFWRSVQWAPDAVAEAADWPGNAIDLKARNKYLKAQYPGLLARLLADPRHYDPELAGWYAWCQSSAIHGSQRSSTLRLYKVDGVHRERDRGSLYGYYRDLSERLRYVTIHYGNWSRLARVARHCARLGQGDVAVFLDPPYVAASRKSGIYRQDSGTVAYRVHRWALAAAKWGVKVALAGYAGDYEMPKTWEEYAWASRFGRGRERLWFSPGCRPGRA
jgi:DNA adenine methylase